MKGDSGFNFTYEKSVERPGFQMAFKNDYGVTFIPMLYSESDRVQFDKVSVTVMQEVDEVLEKRTVSIMEKMGYNATLEELENGMFINIDAETYAQILYTVSMIGETIH